MKILIYGANFVPEPAGIGKYPGEMAEWLAARGHIARAVRALSFAICSLPLMVRRIRSGSHSMGLLSNEFVRGIVPRAEGARIVDV